eukprot:13214_1
MIKSLFVVALLSIFIEAQEYELLVYQDAQICLFDRATIEPTGGNQGTSSDPCYSNIGTIAQIKDDYRDKNGKFTFRLTYYDPYIELIWQQKSWITDSQLDGAILAIIPTQNDELTEGQYFHGLGLNTYQLNTHSYIDGTPGDLHGNWWNAVVTYEEHVTGIPGFNGVNALRNKLEILVFNYNSGVDCIEGSTYSAWSGCDAACDQTGEETRIRSGDIPAVNGGAECSNAEEKRSCIGPPCAVNCVLGDWYDNGECSDICGGGLINQHRDVDTYPAHGGTECGSQEQEVACNGQECCAAPGIGTFDWDKMTGQGEDVPDFNIIEFKGYDNDLTLNIVVELEYLGKTKANNHREAKFGTTYVLDFEDFDAHSDKIQEPG